MIEFLPEKVALQSECTVLPLKMVGMIAGVRNLLSEKMLPAIFGTLRDSFALPRSPKEISDVVKVLIKGPAKDLEIHLDSCVAGRRKQKQLEIIKNLILLDDCKSFRVTPNLVDSSYLLLFVISNRASKNFALKTFGR